MATTNFTQVNPTAANQETDSQFQSDSLTTGGVGIDDTLPSKWLNKVWYQASTFIAALCQALVAKGYTTNDADLGTLAGVLGNIITNNDLKSGISTVNYSPTPTFDASKTNGFFVSLGGNITSSALSNQAPGQELTFVFVQNAGGGLTVTWPAGFNGFPQIDPAANAVSVVTAYVDANGNVRFKGAWSANGILAAGGTDGQVLTQQNGVFKPLALPSPLTRGPLMSNANGYYYQWSDGVIEQWGVSSNIPSGGLSSVVVTFPVPFTTVGSINFQCGLTERRSTGSDSGAGAWGSRASLNINNITVNTEMDGGANATAVWWRAVGK